MSYNRLLFDKFEDGKKTYDNFRFVFCRRNNMIKIETRPLGKECPYMRHFLANTDAVVE